MTKLKKIIIISLGILILLGGLEYWHYRKINAFYFSYQNHESMLKQQNAFSKSVRTTDLEKLRIKSSPYEKSIKIEYIYFEKNEFKYTFMPQYPMGKNKLSDALIISVISKESNKRVSLFGIKNDFKQINSGSDRNADEYRNKALMIYKSIYKQLYNNWKIRYW